MQKVKLWYGAVLSGFAMALMLLRVSSAAQQAPPVSMENDARLNRVVDVQYMGIETGALLRNMSDAKVFLRADHYCAAQKLQIKLTKRPLRVLMQSLADLLPGKWEPDVEKTGYTLVMDAEAVKRRERWQRLIRDQGEFAREERRKALLKAMRTEPPPTDFSQPDHTPPATDARDRSNLAFFRALPASLQEDISRAFNDSGQYLGETTLNDFSDDTARVHLSELPAAAQDILRQRFRAFENSKPPTANDPMVFFPNTMAGVGILISSENGTVGENGTVADHSLPRIVFLWARTSPD